MSSKPKDITGMKFNKLTAIKPTGEIRHRTYMWLLQCDCGNMTTSTISRLKNETKKSCGCNLKEKRKPRPDVSERMKNSGTHGQTGSRTYASWNSMKGRCLNPADKDFKNYGGRGVKITEDWISSFESFLKDMGERPQGMTIDRINVNGNYEPENCRWATPHIQANNTRVCRYVEYQGKTQTASEWAREVGLEIKTLQYRLRVGWDAEKALTTPSTIKRK